MTKYRRGKYNGFSAIDFALAALTVLGIVLAGAGAIMYVMVLMFSCIVDMIISMVGYL